MSTHSADAGAERPGGEEPDRRGDDREGSASAPAEDPPAAAQEDAEGQDHLHPGAAS